MFVKLKIIPFVGCILGRGSGKTGEYTGMWMENRGTFICKFAQFVIESLANDVLTRTTYVEDN